ncbi:MAG: hypothetical protein ACNA8W_21930 [Bradymonadaceae bacterium]
MMRNISLVTTITGFEFLGQFNIEKGACTGETTLEFGLPMKAGSWRAWHLDAELLDDLIEEGLSEAEAREQLLLIHNDAEPPTGTTLPPMVKVTSSSIEGARFTLACDSVRAIFETADGFWEHLDGVHGILENGRGLHLMLDGDGQADIWCDSSGTLVLVELL